MPLGIGAALLKALKKKRKKKMQNLMDAYKQELLQHQDRLEQEQLLTEEGVATMDRGKWLEKEKENEKKKKKKKKKKRTEQEEKANA